MDPKANKRVIYVSRVCQFKYAAKTHPCHISKRDATPFARDLAVRELGVFSKLRRRRLPRMHGFIHELFVFIHICSWVLI